MIRSRDTSVEARRFQLQVLRRISPAERVANALQMIEEVRRVSADGLRHRHPDLSSSEIDDATWRLMRRGE